MFSARTAKEPRERPPFCSGTTKAEKEETMTKQRFLVLFRHWFFTVAKVCGPIVVYELFALVRQHSHYPPLGMSDLLMEALLAFLLTALLCWLGAPGEWTWSRLRRFTGLQNELRQCSRSHWKPEAARIVKT